MSEEFLVTAELMALRDLRRDRGLLPKASGVYGLFFSKAPGVAPTGNCLGREGRWLMYIGVAGAGPGSGGTLRSRIGGAHLGGNERRSTLCQTLAALLPDLAGPALARAEPGGIKYHTEKMGAQRIRGWMEAHIAVAWTSHPRPGDVEERLLCRYVPPLNISGSDNPFKAELRRLRTERREAALV